MTDLKYYTNIQKTVATIFYISIVVAFIITIGGTVYTIADLIMAEGKMELFQGLSFGFQIAIVGALLAGLFILIIFFYGLFKKGKKTLIKLIYKDRELEEQYKHRIGIKIVAGGLMLCIFAIIIGIIISIIYEIFVSSSLYPFQLIGNFSTGQIVLLFGFSIFIIIGLIFAFIFLWHNGYYVIVKIISDLEEED